MLYSSVSVKGRGSREELRVRGDGSDENLGSCEGIIFLAFRRFVEARARRMDHVSEFHRSYSAQSRLKIAERIGLVF